MQLAQNTTEQAAPAFDPMTLILLAAFAFLIFMMFRGRKKAKKQQQELQSELRPGAEVMTQFGLYGKVVSIDTDENKVVIELSPGSTATVHSQAVARVVPAAVPADDAETPSVAAPVAEPTAATGAAGDAVHEETPEETLRRLDGDDRTKE
ncbi:preprotein translocase subunit YajC [Arthrobacter halodurans]|uniref:Preprotein translocase subunit YajC n=1 Tax=Arthrobacter halodurans TaxID=516699 RepID=A0ABV4ULA2_9MICC